MMTKILGISRIDEGRRLYIPKGLADELNIKCGDSISFKPTKKGIKVFPKKNLDNAINGKVDSKYRIYFPEKALSSLNLKPNEKVIVLKEEDIVLARLEDRIK